MPQKIIFMYSGQGSQYFHMGSDLFENHQLFREQIFFLNDIVSGIIGESVIDQIYSKAKKKSELFNRTLYTHPAIFMVEMALTRVLLDEGITPDYVFGSSMGEFASAACSGVMELEGIIDILMKQAQALELCPKGGMLAILEKPALYYNEAMLCEHSELAGINFDSHFVVSGNDDSLKNIIAFLKAKSINYQLLPVLQAFHSSLIEPAGYTFVNYLAQKDFEKPQKRFISGVYGKEIADISDTYLWEIVRKPIQFQEAVRALEQNNNYIYIDLGPSGTLATFLKYNLKQESDSKTFGIITPFGQDLKNLHKMHDFLL